tara:strand:+ start:127 stop:489 length:363 start_codon:yes stop_codon:yes gene_type:complete
MSSIDLLLGRSIAEQRALRCMSQKELADKLGLSMQTIDAFERGARRASAKQLFEISEVLEVQIEGLFSTDDSFESGDYMLSLPPEVQGVIGHYEALSKTHRSAIFAFLLALDRDYKQTHA